MLMHNRCPPAPQYRYRILYLGTNAALVTWLNRELAGLSCHVCYVPVTRLARPFIASYGEYALLLFDEHMPETTGAELAEYARALRHREQTPSLIIKATVDFNLLAQRIRHLLATIEHLPHHPFAP